MLHPLEKLVNTGKEKRGRFPIHPDLKVFLGQYQAPEQGYLFPSSRSASGHITRRGVDDFWRRNLINLGYSGFSTHSSRRWVINQLRKAGTEVSIIAETMRISITIVRRYLDDDPVACQKAIASLSV